MQYCFASDQLCKIVKFAYSMRIIIQDYMQKCVQLTFKDHNIKGVYEKETHK